MQDGLIPSYAAQSARVDDVNFIIDSPNAFTFKVFQKRKDDLFEVKRRDDSAKRKQAVLELTANRAQRNIHAFAQAPFDNLRNTTSLNNRLYFV